MGNFCCCSKEKPHFQAIKATCFENLEKY